MAFRIVLSVLLCVSVFGGQKGSLYRFYTKGDYKIKSEYEYAEIEYSHDIQCVFKCAIDTKCNSASYQYDTGRCILSEKYAIAGYTQSTRNHLTYDEGWNLSSLLEDEGQDTMCMDTDRPGGEICYKFTSPTESYSNAKQRCSDLGGKLAEPSSSYDNEMIKSVVRQLSVTKTWWFGLNDMDDEGQWVWLTSGHAPSYTDWKNRNPNQGLASNCGALYYPYDYGWVDESCSKSYSAVCELQNGTFL